MNLYYFALYLKKRTNMITYNETNFLRKESLNKEYLFENLINFQEHSKTIKVFEVFMKKGKPKSVFIIRGITV